MKKMKALCLILALTMLVFTVSSCTSTAPASAGSADTPPAETPVSAAPPESEPEEQVTGTFICGIWPADTDYVALQQHLVYEAIFNAEHSNIEFVRFYYKYATDNFLPMVQAGTVPTIFESWFTEPAKLIESGGARDITDILNERGWAEAINPSIKELLSKDGKIYGIPRDAYALGLGLNLELFEQAGLMNADGTPQYPKTWEELAAAAKKIKDETGAAGLCLLAKDNAGGWHWSNIAWAFGANLVTDNGDGTFTSNLDSAEAVAAMEYTKSLKWEYDVLTADPLSEDWGTGFTQLGTGAAAMYIMANDATEQPTANNGLAVDKFALVPVPAGPGGQYSLSGGTPYFFGANASDAEVNAALDYLILMGKAPVLNDLSIAGMKAGNATKVSMGAPVIQRFPCWTLQELIDKENEITAEFSNVNEALYADYFKAVTTEGNLRLEESGQTQNMYAELTKVLQEVLTNSDADVAALMKTADENYQSMLDNPTA
ncbi:MAG: extracellular solute-binding protein [Oscillospiraceae bacterium]|jgi:ABC-type glycerol-3-phosphate transport system substrate-binding protein|nr:extracellular solute-binding protein [Oscillospiraceae bacterium]